MKTARLQSREMADSAAGADGRQSAIHDQHRQPAGATGSSGRTPGAIVSIPHDVRRFIDRQIDELSESDRNLLTAASVIRREFATAAVAAALEIDIEQVESTLRAPGAAGRVHRQVRIDHLAGWHARGALFLPA